MGKPMNNSDKGHTKVKDMVVLTLLSDIDQAKEYETLLRLNDIPTTLKEEMDAQGESKGVAKEEPIPRGTDPADIAAMRGARAMLKAEKRLAADGIEIEGHRYGAPPPPS